MRAAYCIIDKDLFETLYYCTSYGYECLTPYLYSINKLSKTYLNGLRINHNTEYLVSITFFTINYPGLIMINNVSIIK